MQLFILLFFLFVLLANLELYCFMTLGSVIGVLPTLTVIIGTGMLGAYMAKSEGSKSWNKIKSAFAHGRNPSTEVINGLCILLAGIALCIPGFITDICGFLLLLPPLRHLLVQLIRKHWTPLESMGFATFQHDSDDDTDDSPDDSDDDTPGGPSPFRHTATASDEDVIDVEPIER